MPGRRLPQHCRNFAPLRCTSLFYGNQVQMVCQETAIRADTRVDARSCSAQDLAPWSSVKSHRTWTP